MITSVNFNEESLINSIQKTAKKHLKGKPITDINKIFGIDLNSLKVIEKKLPNQAAEFSYYLPNSNEPCINIFEQGLLHREIIKKGKDLTLYLKRVGEEEPFICINKGKTIQISQTKKQAYSGIKKHTDSVYYYDGENSLELDKDGETRGYISAFDPSAKSKRTEFPKLADVYPDYRRHHFENSCIPYSPYHSKSLTPSQIIALEIHSSISEFLKKTKLCISEYIKL